MFNQLVSDSYVDIFKENRFDGVGQHTLIGLFDARRSGETVRILQGGKSELIHWTTIDEYGYFIVTGLKCPEKYPVFVECVSDEYGFRVGS